MAVIVGTRPEAVKLAGIIRALGERAVLIHTGQHFDPELAADFMAALRLEPPAVQLQIGGGTRDDQLTRGTAALLPELERLAPAAVVVQGDTNSTLAGARAARIAGIPVVHVEAGLRSFDSDMPEEHNRIETDHLSALCLAPTDWAAKHLADDGITGDRVVVTGNTAVDAVLEALPRPDQRAEAVRRAGLEAGRFVLATIHRPENTDDPRSLRTILEALVELPLPVVLPLHPRTAGCVNAAGLDHLLAGLRTVEPLEHAEFLALAAESALLVSDSGGIQEEASVLKRPVLVVRRSTERPEVQGTFAKLLRPDELRAAALAWLDDAPVLHDLPSPYGDGHASERCVDAIDLLLNTIPSVPFQAAVVLGETADPHS